MSPKMRFLAVCVVAVTILGVTSTAIFADGDRAAKIQSQIDSMLERISTLQSRQTADNFADIQSRIDVLRADIDSKQKILDRLSAAETIPIITDPVQAVIGMQAQLNDITAQLNGQVSQVQAIQRGLSEIVKLDVTPALIEVPARDMESTTPRSYMSVNNTAPTAGDVVGFSGVVYPEWDDDVYPVSQYAGGAPAHRILEMWEVNVQWGADTYSLYEWCSYEWLRHGDDIIHHAHAGATHSHDDYMGAESEHGTLDCTITHDPGNTLSVNGTFTVGNEWLVDAYEIYMHVNERYELGNTGADMHKSGDARTYFTVMPLPPGN